MKLSDYGKWTYLMYNLRERADASSLKIWLPGFVLEEDVLKLYPTTDIYMMDYYLHNTFQNRKGPFRI